jgi:general secretion pathway protein K
MMTFRSTQALRLSSCPSGQKGVALLTVMLLMAVMVVVASQFTQRLQLDIARSINQAVAAKGYWYSLGAEAFLLEVLSQDLEDDETVHLDQYWATQNAVFPIEDEEDGQIAVSIDDMQACFNLNSLAQPDSDSGDAVVATIFEQLLVTLGVDSYLAEQITDATRDWVDEDTVPRDNGAEDGVYEGMNEPYLPANSAMVDASEWRSVNGVSAAIYNAVRPYVCALPETDLEINVNTIRSDRATLLVALFPDELDLETAMEVIQDRPQDGYTSADELVSDSAFNGASLSDKSLSSVVVVTSNYFRGNISVKLSDDEARMSVLIKRSGTNDLTVINRVIGGWQ